MSNIVKASITLDGNLIELTMSHSNKDIIHACLENTTANLNASQKTITGPLVESKKNELNFVETKLKLAEEFHEQLEEFHEQLNDKQIKNLKTNEQRFSVDILYANIMLNNASEIKMLLDQINKIKTELSSEQTKDAGMALPVNIERKSFPSAKLGLFLGLFLGLLFTILQHNKAYLS
jgi:hypothetical protein